MSVAVEFSEKTGIHRAFLSNECVAVMYSSDATKPFQRLAKHRVPVYAKAKGWRLNWTIRTSAKRINPDLSRFPQTVDIGEGLELKLKVIPESLSLLQQELLGTLKIYGHPDVTTVFGRQSDNNGRMVLEQSLHGGKSYAYSGKVTTPGVPFGPHALEYLNQVAVVEFGVPLDELWAHLVYYPDPAICKLDWHSDSEDGVNPNMIMSVTFLEDPEKGIRPFDVRLKSLVEKKKRQKKE
jgi:hypothetical protein